MLITSLLFICYLVIAIFIYYLFPKKYRFIGLFIANSGFIISFGISLYIFIMIFALFNYIFLFLIIKLKTLFQKLIYIFALSFNVFILLYFKYLNFIIDNINRFFSKSTLFPSIAMVEIIIPIGLSFFVFKVLSLLTDVYKKKYSKISFFEFFSYVLFFPQFLSGPIERFLTFKQSFARQTGFDVGIFISGVERIIYGFFKKMVLADNLSIYVNNVFTSPLKFGGFDFIIAAYFFSFQLYFDFSGYSDIAIGISKILGFNTPENFNLPYLANSIKDFWRRWHISLSSWFKDYLYIPLGGNRKGKFRTYLNILIVFLLTGLWHGAGWTFIIWGILHGLYQIISNVYFDIRKIVLIKNRFFLKIENDVGIFLTFHFVTLTWIFFRSNSIRDAIHMLNYIFTADFVFTNIKWPMFYPLLLAIIVNFVKKIFYNYKIVKIPIGRIILYFLLLIIIIFGGNYTPQDFLYFKF